MDVGAGPRTGLGGWAMPPAVSAVIPTLNEEQNIGWVLERLPSCVGSCFASGEISFAIASIHPTGSRTRSRRSD